MTKLKRKTFWKLVLIVLGVFLFLAGLGIELLFVKICGLLIAVLLLSLAKVWKRKLKLPPGIILYVLFLIAFEASLIWSRNRGVTAGHLVSFIAGGLFWIAFYNLSSEFSRWLDKIIVILGLVFGGMFIVNHYFGEVLIRPWSLYLPYTHYLNHNNIGDLWALVLTIVAFYLIGKPKNFWYWGLVSLGFYFLAMSQSRSAYVALAVGVIYLAKSQGWTAKYMSIVLPFKPKGKRKAPATVHVDGSGRLQTLVRKDSPLYYDLIETYKKKTGTPIIINTSFNVRGEPIVCTPEEAVKCFLRTGIDVLVIDRFVVVKGN